MNGLIQINFSINLDKTHYIQFKTNHNTRSHLEISQLNKQILPISYIKFLGIYINDTINWKNHIEYIVPKLSTACHTMRMIKPYMSLDT